MKGQTAIEYLLMISIILTMLTFLTYYAQDMTERNREEIMVSDVTIAVNKIAEASDIVFTQGSPSQITFSVYIPEDVYSIQFSNNMVIMRLNTSSGTNDIFATSKANFNGSSLIQTSSGTKSIVVKAEGSDVIVTQKS